MTLNEIRETLQSLIPLAKNIIVSEDIHEYGSHIKVYISALDIKDIPEDEKYDKYVSFCLRNKHTTENLSGYVNMSEADINRLGLRYVCSDRHILLSALYQGYFTYNTHEYKKYPLQEIADYTNKVFNALNDYTGGYPYTKGIEEKTCKTSILFR